MINLLNLKIKYGSRIILDIPKLTLNDGERYAVIGANGSGKTTLLRMIPGLLIPSSGNISIPYELNNQRGYMPQQPYIFGFSVLKNVTMALERNDHSEGVAIEALKAVGMESFIRAKGKSLSGGEAQRVSFARIIALPRKLLILDEPTSSTDIAGNDLIEAALVRLLRQNRVYIDSLDALTCAGNAFIKKNYYAAQWKHCRKRFDRKGDYLTRKQSRI